MNNKMRLACVCIYLRLSNANATKYLYMASEPTDYIFHVCDIFKLLDMCDKKLKQVRRRRTSGRNTHNKMKNEK